MGCSRCGTELIPGKPFCHACGARVELTCASCGAALQPTFRFCPECGATVAGDGGVQPALPADDRLSRLSKHIPAMLAEKIRASQGAIAGERKLVTVLFCDLVGSTAIAEQLDPEEYRDLLDEYLELAFREIYRFEGIVNQLAGDGMMALFGAPIAHEDAPQRAVRAALAIREALERFNREFRSKHGIEVQARIGIHSGPVVVGTVGNDFKMDYTATGDTTNLASRLESLAAPGTILISEATHRLVRGFFEVRTAGPFAVKGKSDSIPAYEVLRTSAALTPIAVAAARGLTPLVGRGGELAQLRACYERLAGHLPQLVAVVGDAGSGKSRLIHEFKRLLAGEPVTIFEAHCSSLTQMQPYAPVASMLRPHFGIEAGQPMSVACERVAETLRDWSDPALPLEQAHPFLCRLLSLSTEVPAALSAEELKRETFEAVAHFVLAQTRKAPVLIIIEDLHWTDDASRELIELAVARMYSAPLMLLVSHRPDYMPLWRAQVAFTQLTLRHLSDEESGEIIRAIAGGSLPAELERLICVHAEGNPFFTEEITRALLEEGSLVRRDGRIEVTRPLEDIRIPETVQELLEARLDRLGAHAKRVTQVAAVLGRQFHRDQLACLLEGEGIDVAGQLEGLERRGVLHRQGSRSEQEFRFGESLTQEVAYEGLLLKERRRLHERVGLLLEELPGEPTPERSALMAFHFSRSDNRAKAIAALLRAGQDAERLPSWRAAGDFYYRAWELAEAALDGEHGGEESLRRSALEAALSFCRITVSYGSNARAGFERVARRGRALAESLGEVDTVAGICAYHGMQLSAQRERFTEGLALVEEGFALAQRAGSEMTAINISRALAFGYLYDGRFDLAQGISDWVVAELEKRGQRERLTDLYLGARWMRDAIYGHSDHFQPALEGLLDTYDLAVQAPNRTMAITAAGTLAQLNFACGRYADAKTWVDRCLEAARAIGHVASIHTASAMALATGVELGETVPLAEYADAIEEGLASGGNTLLSIRWIVDALLALNELALAHRFAQMACERAAGRLKEMLTMAALGAAVSRLAPDRWAEAEHWFQRAMDLAQTLGVRSTLAQTLIGMGELAAARGDQQSGVAHVRRALTICREIGFNHYGARAERWLREHGSEIEGRVH